LPTREQQQDHHKFDNISHGLIFKNQPQVSEEFLENLQIQGVSDATCSTNSSLLTTELLFNIVPGDNTALAPILE